MKTFKIVHAATKSEVEQIIAELQAEGFEIFEQLSDDHLIVGVKGDDVPDVNGNRFETSVPEFKKPLDNNFPIFGDARRYYPLSREFATHMV